MAARKKALGTEAGGPAEQSAGSPFNRTLKYGADGEDVKALQTALLAAGCTVAVNGVYDLQTMRAVQHVQREKNMLASGIIGKRDYAALLDQA